MIQPRTSLGTIAALVCVSLSCWPAEHPETDAPEAFIALPGVSGSALPVASPEELGISEVGLAHMQSAMQSFVDDGRVAGIVTMLAREGRIAHWEAVGWRRIETGVALEPDDIFRIYSMTKPITSVAIMMLVEAGKISLDDPVSKYAPSFSGLSVLLEDGSRVPAARPVTVQDLLTHSGGLSYGLFTSGVTEAVDEMYKASGLWEATSLEEFVRIVASLPLIDHPGVIWNYGVSTGVLGYIVQVASGQPFEVFLKDRIFTPLGMDDTAFWVPPDKIARLATHYALSDRGLVVADNPDTGRYSQMPAFAYGGGGLVSTASDYIRFAQMLLQEGQLEGVRILRGDTVRLMRTNQLPPAMTPISLGDSTLEGYGFGLGFATLINEDATEVADHNGLFRWVGLANTFFWIDPELELVAMVWTQLFPFGAYGLERTFQELVYEAIEGD
jgi:CubicO group peptidase (beta-lactamase class C family)